MTEECNPCEKTFAREHQDLIDDVCYLKNVTLTDKFVKVSDNDPTSAYLSDKLVGVSGITFTEMTDGVSGNVYVAGLDVPFFDSRYAHQLSTINLGLNEGIHNGYVSYNRINGIQSLRYSVCGNASSSWNFKIPNEFTNIKSAKLNIRWACADNVSGTVIFGVEYNSINLGEHISLFQNETVTGISDGSDYKLYESTLSLNTFIMNPEDQFLLKIRRINDSISDTLEGPIEIIGVSLDYNIP